MELDDPDLEHEFQRRVLCADQVMRLFNRIKISYSRLNQTFRVEAEGYQNKIYIGIGRTLADAMKGMLS